MTALANPRREKFCRLYAMHGNGARAGRGAGYAKSSAGVEAGRLLKNPVIMARIQQLVAKDAHLLKISREEALHEVSSLANFNPQDLYDDDGELIPIQDLTPEVAKSVREIKSSIIPAQYDVDGNITRPARVAVSSVKAGSDKRAAIDMALRIHNAYEDHEGAGKGTINIYMDEKDMQA